jgi:hypothetical protein
VMASYSELIEMRQITGQTANYVKCGNESARTMNICWKCYDDCDAAKHEIDTVVVNLVIADGKVINFKGVVEDLALGWNIAE